MPLFFIDVHDGRSTLVDTVGIELADRYEAADEAAGLLPDFAREVMPDGQANDFAAAVRDDSGATIYRALLLFRGQWSEQTHAVSDEVCVDPAYEFMRSAKLRREATALRDKFADAIPEMVECLNEMRMIREASEAARGRRSVDR